MTRAFAPIALFVYRRLDLARRTVDALAENAFAEQSDLIVFSDGPRSEADAPKIAAIRDYIPAVKGFANVRLVPAASNMGLSRSIVDGVTRVTDEYGRVIVLEDDILTSPHFLRFMNDALDKYAEDERVAAVSGYLPPFDIAMPETFFQHDAECWGWGTWARAWQTFNPDGSALLTELKRKKLLRFFDQDNSAAYVDMLKDQIAGNNDSWAVRWRASVVLANKLSLYPHRSLTENIGFDGSGTHCDDNGRFPSDGVSDTPIAVKDVSVTHLEDAFKAFGRFNRGQNINPLKRRIKRRAGALLRHLGLR